jgi:hypothetical protein
MVASDCQADPLRSAMSGLVVALHCIAAGQESGKRAVSTLARIWARI